MFELKFARRSVAMAIILTIVTCGIYGIYWLYQILTAYYRANGQRPTAGVDILLSFVTCGIYGIYLMYKIGKLESSAYYQMGWQKDDSVLYLLLTIFGLSIVVYGIVQSNINYLADHADGPHDGPGSWPPSGPGAPPPPSSGGNGLRPPGTF